MNSEDKLVFKYILWFFGFLFLLILNPIFHVGVGERALILNNFVGVKSNVYAEGWHLQIPIVEQVFKYDVKTQKYEVEADCASKDLQSVMTKVALNYHVDPDKVYLLHKEIGIDYRSRIIEPTIEETLKSATSKFQAEELITKREQLNREIVNGLKEKLEKYHIFVDGVNIANFQFSPQFNQAIEAKVTAEQEALREQMLLEKIKFQAQQKIAEAEGQANSTIMRANADAKAIELINEQLYKSSNYIEYIKAQQWDGKLPNIMTGNSGVLLELPIVN